MNFVSRLVPEQWSRHPFVARLQGYMRLREGELESLWRLIDIDMTVEKRRDVVIDGYEYRKLCFIEEGFAARYKLLHNGRRQIVNLLLPGDIIGLPSGFLEKARYTVTALTGLKLQGCSVNAYVDLCYRQPQFGLALSWLAMHEAITYAEHAINTGRRTPTERIAHFLLEIHSRLAEVGRASESGFDLPFSQEVMSDVLGLSVPHLNRTLAKLRVDGHVEITGHHFRFCDIKALELLGHFQPLNLISIPPAFGFNRSP